MKKGAIYLLLLFLYIGSQAQYYLRGEVKDEKNVPLSNAQIFVHSAKVNYYTGAYGDFGINMSRLYDTLTVSLNGYEPITLKVKSDVWQTIILKIAISTQSKNRPKLISVIGDASNKARVQWPTSDETYFQLIENNFVETKLYPNTGYALNVNKASYSNVRRFLNMGSAVPPDAVRVEEMINYFNLGYEQPTGTDPFKISSLLTDCPWDAGKQLLCIDVSAKMLPLDKIPQGNFVFLIDVSGSMDMPNRLPLLQAAFKMFVRNLRPIDTVSIVTYGGSVGVWLGPTSGADKETIIESIESLVAAGDTPGESAIRTAYKLAESNFIAGGNNRVILATDGDFNVGETSEKSLEELITKMKQSGVYLTCLGVGMGNFKDSKLQILAKKGNGNYAYLDDINEAEKVLIEELTQTFYTVGGDVSMNVNFNSQLVEEYRLIGFDNRKDAMADVSSVLEGGEVGSGSNTIAIFEIVPKSKLITRQPDDTSSIAFLTLNYRNPNDSVMNHMRYSVKKDYTEFNQLPQPFRFVITVAMFGLKLKQSQYFPKSIKFEDIKKIAESIADKSSYLQSEFLDLIDKASVIYEPKKKKKRGFLGL